MYSNLSFLLPLSLLVLHVVLVGSENTSIIYQGFKTANLTLDGVAEITPNGLLKLTNDTEQETGHAFYPAAIPFKGSRNGSVVSFSTTFVFGIISEFETLSGHGIAFTITPNRGLPYSFPSQYLGLFNETNNGSERNRVVAVELDTIKNEELGDVNDNHVGVDINGLKSIVSAPASYFINASSYVNVSLHSGEPMQVWIEYDGSNEQMNITLAPIHVHKPTIPLLSLSRDLSHILNDGMYIGFSSSTGSVSTSHYVLGWSFSTDNIAPSLNISSLPKLPKTTHRASVSSSSRTKTLTIGLILVIVVLAIVTMSYMTFYMIQRRLEFSEESEDWESEYGPQRFKYKDLYKATKGFQDKKILGVGGFGKVYSGILPKSKTHVAVKKVSHESRQGIREFIAEIVSIGRVRHRNLVPLLGYCRRKGELLLVYEYMPNGSLDKMLHQNRDPGLALGWSQRFKIIKGVASGLLYLHEGWEQVVVHRDIKASNVLLDSELNARLGDFGLARLYDHEADPKTTHMIGTIGYMAPEHSRMGKPTRCTDVFAFGAFMLEVVCGRRPVDLRAPKGEIVLVDMVYGWWKSGEIARAVDVNLRGKYVEEEVDKVLKMGLMCSSVDPEARPTMKDVVAYMDGAVTMPELRGLVMANGGVSFATLP